MTNEIIKVTNWQRFKTAIAYFTGGLLGSIFGLSDFSVTVIFIILTVVYMAIYEYGRD